MHEPKTTRCSKVIHKPRSILKRTNGSENNKALLQQRSHVPNLSPSSSSPRTTTPTRLHSRRSVHFTAVTVHYHATILGDNPSVSCGAPLALGWKRVFTSHYADLRSYEAQEHPYISSKSIDRLKLSAQRRESRLLQQGFGIPDIRRCMFQISALKKEAKRNKADFEQEKRDPLVVMGPTTGSGTHPVNEDAVRKSFPVTKSRDVRITHCRKRIGQLFQGRRHRIFV